MLYTQYIFLDNDERKLFAQSNHKYLIEQIQFNGSDYYDSDDIIANIPLRFYHPIKEIIWIVQDNTYIPYNYPFTYVPFNNGKIINNDFVKSAYIEINGKQRIMKKSGSYYRMVQSWQHHTGNYKHFNKIVSNNLVSNKNIIEKGFIYLYSFALNPENYEAYFNLGTRYLYENNFKEGWKYYEYRLKKNKLSHDKYPNKIEDITQKKILIN